MLACAADSLAELSRRYAPTSVLKIPLLRVQQLPTWSFRGAPRHPPAQRSAINNHGGRRLCPRQRYSYCTASAACGVPAAVLKISLSCVRRFLTRSFCGAPCPPPAQRSVINNRGGQRLCSRRCCGYHSASASVLKNRHSAGSGFPCRAFVPLSARRGAQNPALARAAASCAELLRRSAPATCAKKRYNNRSGRRSCSKSISCTGNSFPRGAFTPLRARRLREKRHKQLRRVVVVLKISLLYG